MTLDDLERQNRRFYEFLLAILGCKTHFKSELRQIHWPRPAAHEMFSIERRFQRSKSRPSRFKEASARLRQKAVPPKNRYFTVVGKSTLKRLQIGMGMLPTTTSFSDELFSRININGFERP